MTRRDYEAQAIKSIKSDWFPEHKATLLPLVVQTEGVETTAFDDPAFKTDHIIWQRPGTGIFRVDYFFWRGTLFVTGDIGSAVYRWHTSIGNIHSLGDLNYDYFISKLECVNSRHGHEAWDSRVAKFEIERFLREEGNEGIAEIIDDWWGHISDRNEWDRRLWEEYGSLDSEVLSCLSDLGVVPEMRTLGHWLGIKMALEQLEVKAQ